MLFVGAIYTTTKRVIHVLFVEAVYNTTKRVIHVLFVWAVYSTTKRVIHVLFVGADRSRANLTKEWSEYPENVKKFKNVLVKFS